jgi:hypothetical protein
LNSRIGPLVLKRASASRSSGEWSDDDYDVLADGGRSRPHHEGGRETSPTHPGCGPTGSTRTAPRHTAMRRHPRRPWPHSLRVGGGNNQELAARITRLQRVNHLLGAAIAGRSCNITDATPKVIAAAKVRANIVIHICSSNRASRPIRNRIGVESRVMLIWINVCARAAIAAFPKSWRRE